MSIHSDDHEYHSYTRHHDLDQITYAEDSLLRDLLLKERLDVRDLIDSMMMRCRPLWETLSRLSCDRLALK